MDPISILTWAAVWAMVSVMVHVTVTMILLTLDEVFSWFRKHAYLVTGNDIGFTAFKNLGDKIGIAMNDPESYTTIQGVFSPSLNKIKEARVVKSSYVDLDFLRNHEYGRREIKLYTS
ncbi:hypothetical protein [Oxynema aestuarii]|uniref:Uncharacterized protein n=1 Tax=Oxynema aestuarii AP17 TaxID=2064643 RepID=A0A6H1TWT2_9CYAN|nr:hypothetical protein [Oxynema aestuarii]QIZ70666.1 hypothetical protein HCG48_08805 [Oxynema aestuarii AP17]